MVKNYLLDKTTYELTKRFFLINLLFLFILTAYTPIYSQGQPVIQAPVINNIICAGSTASVMFTTVDGNGANSSNGKAFTSSTTYKVYTANDAEFTVVASSTQNNYSTSSEVVTLTIQIPTNYTPAFYQIKIISSQPDAGSGLSNQFEIKAKPLAPAATSNSPLCAGGTINLTASTITGASYVWTGPNGFTSDLQNPSIANSTVAMSGIYSVKAVVNTCSSNLANTTVVVNANPSITSTTPRSRCGAGTVLLSATASTGTLNWYSVASGGSILGTGSNFTTPNISSTTTYYVDATSNNCTTKSRSAVIATINTIPTAPIVGSNSPVCAGGTINLTANSTSGATYMWTGPNGFSSSLQNPSILNANGSNAGIYTVTSSLNGCPSINATINITVKTDFNWTGVVSTNWNTSSNWSCNAIPTINSNVTIPAGLSNYPVLNTGAEAACKNLTINSGATLTVVNNIININGAVVSNSNFDALNGTVRWVANTAQAIPANTFLTNRIKNLIVENNSGVVLNGVLAITGYIKATTGNFNTSGNLTLISNPTQTALIDGSGNGTISGNVKMQRYLDSAFGYKYFSSPFSNSTVGDFSGFVDLNASFPQVYSYNENSTYNTVSDITGWKPYTDASAGLSILEGYAFNFGAASRVATVELNGTVNNGDFSRQLSNNNGTYTDGFNLVGNPYPSPINLDSSGLTKTNVDNAIYLFSATEQYKGTYSSYVNNVSSTNGSSSNIIPSMQGFFVHVNNNGNTTSETIGTLGLTNAVRVNNFTQAFKNPEAIAHSLIRITSKLNDSNSQDALVIYFDPFAKANFEKEKDALKLMNTDESIPNFYSISVKNEKLSINALPSSIINSNERISLGLHSNLSGSMSIQLQDVENLPSNFKVYLIDDVKHTGQNLSENSVYNFQITAGEHNSRFYLIFSEYELTDLALAFNEPFSVKTLNGNVFVNVNLESELQGFLTATSVTGQLLDKINVKGKETIHLDGIKSSGIYFINLSWNDQHFSKKIMIQK